MRKIFLFFFFILLFIYIFIQKTEAVSNFLTNYDVTYKIFNNENSNVKINVTLTSSSDIYYASSYKIEVNFSEIRNIKAFDSFGPIIPTVLVEKDSKIIELKFNDRVIGLGNKLNFTLSFDTRDIARKSGKIWEINIPRLSKQENIDELNVHVITPKSFGNPSIIKPVSSSILSEKNENIFNFSKRDLGKSGISITFGSEQIYQFELKYNLINKNIYPIKTEVALPPTTGYQEIIIDELNPKPTDVLIDQDGNWLALYQLSPFQKMTVFARGKAKVKLNPSKNVLSPKEKAYYLKEKKYWESNDPKIKSIAKDLKTAKNIYKYVVNRLSYDYSRVINNKPRLGALNVLTKPDSAVCLEFTDLFIALARAAGIPSREVNGYGFTKNSRERPLSEGQDILHSWPEYYDDKKQKWIMIDPTWGNTTGGIDFFDVLDFDHIVFVIKGTDSEYPIPAGSYKFENKKQSKDIIITLSDTFPVEPTTFQVVENFSKNYISGFPIKEYLTIKNLGNGISDNNQVTIDNELLKPFNQKINFGKIPPYGSINIPILFEKTPFLTNKQGNIRITIGGSTFFYKINLSPFFFNFFILTGGVLIVAVFTIGITIYFFKARNIFFQRQK